MNVKFSFDKTAVERRGYGLEAVRQTMLDGTNGTAPAYTQVSKEDYSAVKKLIGRMERVLRYEHHVPQGFTNYWRYLDYFAVSAEMPENYQAPLDFI